MGNSSALRIVAFGDSITQAVRQQPENRWADLVRSALQSGLVGCDVQMINSGVGGNTSREGLARFEKDVIAHRPDVVLIEFGNDCTPDQARHVTLEEYGRNFDHFIKRARETSDALIVLMTFPPVIDDWHTYADHEFYQPFGGQDAMQNLYRQVVKERAAQHGTLLVDLNAALRKQMAVHGDGEIILPDGVHLTTRGNACVAEVVLPVLLPALERRLAGVSG